MPGTRSVYYERNTGGLYLDISPNRDALARYGLTVGDVQRTIEAAIGGASVTTTVEGRARFSINVRYPQDLRSDVERLKQRAGPGAGGRAAVRRRRRHGRLRRRSRRPPSRGSCSPRGWAEAAAAPGPRRPAARAPPTPRRSTGRGPPARLEQLPMGDRALRSGGAPAAGRFVPLGQVADIRIVGGPPMLRDEGGLLVGYVYVDVDPLGATSAATWPTPRRRSTRPRRAGELAIPPGYFLKWTGQYELLEKMNERHAAW